MAAKPKIGLVGVGAMGSRMASRLADAGYPVMVYDADPARTARFAKSKQIRVARSLRDIGRHAHVLITMLPNGVIVRQVFREMENGALMKSLARGSIVIDTSSSDPMGTQELGDELAKQGIALIDAPVSGGITGAEQGRMVLMIGADDRGALAEVKPILDVLSHKQFIVGGTGQGHAMKCLNNFMSGTAFVAGLEALMIGKKFGLDPALMVDVLNESTGRNFSTDVTLKQEVISRAFATEFALGLLAKDVKIAADFAEDMRVNAPLTRASRDLLARAREFVGGDADHTEAIKYWEMLNDMRLSPGNRARKPSQPASRRKSKRQT